MAGEGYVEVNLKDFIKDIWEQVFLNGKYIQEPKCSFYGRTIDAVRTTFEGLTQETVYERWRFEDDLGEMIETNIKDYWTSAAFHTLGRSMSEEELFKYISITQADRIAIAFTYCLALLSEKENTVGVIFKKRPLMAAALAIVRGCDDPREFNRVKFNRGGAAQDSIVLSRKQTHFVPVIYLNNGKAYTVDFCAYRYDIQDVDEEGYPFKCERVRSIETKENLQYLVIPTPIYLSGNYSKYLDRPYVSNSYLEILAMVSVEDVIDKMSHTEKASYIKATAAIGKVLGLKV